jgi:NADH:ubiquinone oxidoreductase subunit 6 (subunit J)
MNKRNVFVGITLVAFLVVVMGALLTAQWPAGSLVDTNNDDLSSMIFNEYGLAVLVVGIVLFVSMLGGVFIAQEERE